MSSKLESDVCCRLQGYYTKIHTDSVTYVNANSSFFFLLLLLLLLLYCTDFIIYALYI